MIKLTTSFAAIIYVNYEHTNKSLILCINCVHLLYINNLSDKMTDYHITLLNSYLTNTTC